MSNALELIQNRLIILNLQWVRRTSTLDRLTYALSRVISKLILNLKFLTQLLWHQ